MQASFLNLPMIMKMIHHSRTSCATDDLIKAVGATHTHTYEKQGFLPVSCMSFLVYAYSCLLRMNLSSPYIYLKYEAYTGLLTCLSKIG